MRQTPALALSLLVPTLAFAQAKGPPAAPPAPGAAPQVAAPDDGDDDPGSADDEGEGALAKLNLKPTMGPAKIPLGHDLTLDLPAGYLFLNVEDSKKFANALHNVAEPSIVGTLIKADAGWFVEVSYDEDGYIKDDEADKLDADQILQSYKDGTEAANAERVKLGGKPLHVDGWAEMPRYEKSTHHVVWGLIGSSDDGKSINFNTRILGRKGYASLNLICAPEELAAAKTDVAGLLSATTFDQGYRYEDFQPSKDKVAEYGLAALIAGGAGAAALKLVKLGFLAKFGAVFLKGCAAGGKAIIVAIVGLFAAIKRFFTGRKQGE